MIFCPFYRKGKHCYFNSTITSSTETIPISLQEPASTSSGFASNSLSLSSTTVELLATSDLSSVSMPVSTSCGNVSDAVSVSSSSSSSVLSHSSSASSAEKKDKTGTKPAKKKRFPRIQLKKIERSAEGPVVECSFDTYTRTTGKYLSLALMKMSQMKWLRIWYVCLGYFVLVCFCLCIQLPVNSIITLITARLCSSAV